MSARNSSTRAKTAAGASLVSVLTPRMVGRDSEGSGGWTAAAGALVEAFYNRRRLRSAHNFMMPVERTEARTKSPKRPSEIEVVSGDQIDHAYGQVVGSDVRYRFVIDTATF